MITRTGISAVTIGLMLLVFSSIAGLAHPGAAHAQQQGVIFGGSDTLRPAQGVFDPGAWGVKPGHQGVFDPGAWGVKAGHQGVFDPGGWGIKAR